MPNILTHLSVIECKGEDAKTFLQGQLTCNLNKLTPNKTRLAAHCNPKGRVISLFRLMMVSEQQYYLICPASMLEITLTNLNKYAAFSKADLADASNTKTLILENNLIEVCDEKIAGEDVSAQQHLQDILNGIPAIYPESSEQFIPQRLNLFELGGLSFKKGCYLGQEVLSRLYYLGKVKYKMFVGVIECSLQLMPFEKILDQDKKTIGHVVDSIVDENKTYLLFERSVDTQKIAHINDQVIHPLELPYKVDV